MRDGMGWAGLGIVLSLLASAGGMDEIRELASGMTDRTPISNDADDSAALLELIAGRDAGELASAAEDHAKLRAAEIDVGTGRGGGVVSVYRDLMRYPQSSRGAAVAVEGRVDRIEQAPDGLTAQIMWLVPRSEPRGELAILLPESVDPPKEGTAIAAIGIFAKRIVVNSEGEELVAPLVAAADWRKREAGGERDASWDVVRDRTLGVRPEESQLYYDVLARAAEVEPAVIREKAREFASQRREANPKLIREGEYWTFADLIKNPEEMRGNPVTLTGYAREIRSYPAGENAEGIETLYEIWMFTDNSQSNPAVVVTSEVPKSLPIGDDLQTPIRVTGYFFKLYGYHAASKTRIAPMILAGPVQILAEPELDGFPWWMMALVGGGFLLALGWIVMSFRGDRRRVKKPGMESPPDFSGMG